VGGVTVPVVDVIHMIAVGQGLMTAAVAVPVGVVLMGEMRQRMLVIVALVREMCMPLVDVVHVALMQGSGVAALRPVCMVMLGMDVVRGGHATASPRRSFGSCAPASRRGFGNVYAGGGWCRAMIWLWGLPRDRMPWLAGMLPRVREGSWLVWGCSRGWGRRRG
jgi:hypothetical protein